MQTHAQVGDTQTHAHTRASSHPFTHTSMRAPVPPNTHAHTHTHLVHVTCLYSEGHAPVIWPPRGPPWRHCETLEPQVRLHTYAHTSTCAHTHPALALTQQQLEWHRCHHVARGKKGVCACLYAQKLAGSGRWVEAASRIRLSHFKMSMVVNQLKCALVASASMLCSTMANGQQHADID